MTDLSFLVGVRILVVGLGREGSALALYLAKHGLTVTATDLQPAEKLGPTAADLQQAGVSLVLGQHPPALLDEAELLFVSPGVPLEVPFVQQAAARKIPLSTESRLFCHLCPAPITAITGSSGKTTTTTLLGKMMEADGRRTWVGGNIGRPMINLVDQIHPSDAVVMELSSFQLEYFHAELNKAVDLTSLPGGNPAQLARLLGNWSPPVGAILNITPNHLDRHPSMKHYVRAKRAVIDYQTADNPIILSLDNDMTRTIGYQFGARVRWFSLEAQPANGAGLLGDELALFDQDNQPQPLAKLAEVKLRGAHNQSNILAASLMAREAGVSPAAMRQVITSFTGVAHRLQPVRELNQVTYYNDSIATSPERVVAALQAFNNPMVLLVGGRDKRLPWEDTARLMLRKAHTIILFGEAVDVIAEAIAQVRPRARKGDADVRRCAGLAEAVELSAQVARPGDVVLLSPGCASYDAFTDYVERGERFTELVLQL